MDGPLLVISMVSTVVLVTWFLMLMGTLFIANVFQSKVKAEQELLRRNRELTALNAIAETVSHSLDLDLILNDALDKALEVMDMKGGLIHLLDEEMDELIVAVHRGLSDRYVEGVNRLKVGEGLAGKMVQSEEPVVVADVSNDPRLTRMVVKEDEMALEEWGGRFGALRAKRGGPSMLAAETWLPLSNLSAYLADVGKLGRRTGVRFFNYGHVVSPQNMVSFSMYRANERQVINYVMSLSLTKRLHDISQKNGGRPYGIGVWNTPYLDRIFTREELAQLRHRK